MFIIDIEREKQIDWNNLTALQIQLRNQIWNNAIENGAVPTDDGISVAEFSAAAERMAEVSLMARTPGGPSGEHAMIYRALAASLQDKNH